MFRAWGRIGTDIGGNTFDEFYSPTGAVELFKLVNLIHSAFLDYRLPQIIRVLASKGGSVATRFGFGKNRIICFRYWCNDLK